MTNLYLVPAILNLFDGGTGAPAGESSAPDAGEQTGAAGTQPELQQQSDADSAAEERARAYNDAISQFKDLDDARVQKLVKNRLKGSTEQIRSLQQQNEATQPIIDRLVSKYGVRDLDQLANAIDNDKAMWEAAADEAGMTTEQYTKFQNLQRQNEALVRQQEMQIQQQQQQQRINDLMNQATQLKQTYPGFDLEAEMQSGQFASLLSKGVPVKTAFEVCHMDEIMNNAVKTTQARTEKAITDDIRATGQRPAENGSTQQSAFTSTTDINKLTAKDMDDLIRRARNGEIITLRQ